MKHWRSTERRFIGHPGALLNPNYYAMEMVEGRKTRNDVKCESYAALYSGGIRSLKDHCFGTATRNFQSVKAKRV